MTIEEQMYDEIMHKMPHRIAELVKTIDTIHKMLEAKGYGELSDNLDQLKKALEQAEQEQKDLYEHFYDGKHYDLILPQTYNDVIEDFIDSGYIEDRINEQTDYYRNEDGEVDVSKLDYDPYDEHEAGQLDLYDNFFNFSQNEDFKRFCEYYYNEEYDIEAKGTFKDNYIDENGIFDFKKFYKKTDFNNDVMRPMTSRILLEDKVREELEQAKEAWAEPTKEEQTQTQEKVKPSERKYHPFDVWHDDNFHILYTRGDGNHINEIKYVNGGPVGTLDVKALNLKAGTPKEKLEQIAKNIIASTKAKEAWAEPTKEEEWEQAYVNKDFEALLPDTTEAMKDWLKNDVIDYPNTSIGSMQGMLNYNDYITDRNKLTTYNDYDLISFRDNEFKECKWLDGFEQSEEFKTLCEYYYNEEYDTKESGTFEDNYIKENGDFDFYKFESETNFTEDIANPYFEQMINDPDINEKIEQTNEKIYNAFDERMKAQTQEEDIATFVNNRDYLKINILYTNGDGNHINEIKCIDMRSNGDWKPLTLDVSKMNLAADTPTEKLQQIAKNIIASTKAKDPIIKPEPIKQNNDFER